MSVIVLLADGVRPDTLGATISSLGLAALAGLRDEGGLFTITSCFPSVTGPAYAPLLMGHHPATVGLPALRWYDRSRTACSFPDYARSYVGYQMRYLDRDLYADSPTIFECVPSSLGALSVITRGLHPSRRIGSLSFRAVRNIVRAARTHFTGDLQGWLAIDREVAHEVRSRVDADQPQFTFAAMMGVDKASHAVGQTSPAAADALRILDDLVAGLRADAERRGRWHSTHLWIASDHGHSPVRAHDDLARFVASLGYRVIAHPWVVAIAPDVAVMVSGNAMAHIYLDLTRRTRQSWPQLAPRWTDLARALLARESVDLLIARQGGEIFEVWARGRGMAEVRRHGAHLSYRMVTGDPLGLGLELHRVSPAAAYDATAHTDYPDSIVQISRLLGGARCGDLVISASREWDFRAKHEPIPHVSSHGALHRDHMLVPLLINRRPRRRPRRTVDVMPSALTALGIQMPRGLDGESFV